MTIHNIYMSFCNTLVENFMEENDLDQVITRGLLNISFDYSNVREILSELNKRIDHLRNDSQRAREIKEFNDALFDLKAQIVNCNGRIGEVERSVNFVITTNQKTMNLMQEKFDKLFEQTQTNIDKKTVDLIAASQQQIDTGLINGIAKLKKEFTDNFSTIDMHNDLAFKLDQLNDKVDKIVVTTSEVFDETKLESILDRIGTLEKNMDSAQQTISEHSDNVQNMRSQMDSIQIQTDEVQELVSSRSTDIAKAANDNEEMKNQISAFEDRLKEMQTQIDSIKNSEAATLAEEFTIMQENLTNQLNDMFSKIENGINTSAGRIAIIERTFSDSGHPLPNLGIHSEPIIHLNPITGLSSRSSTSYSTTTSNVGSAPNSSPTSAHSNKISAQSSEHKLETETSMSMLLPPDVDPSQIIENPEQKKFVVPNILGMDKVNSVPPILEFDAVQNEIEENEENNGEVSEEQKILQKIRSEESYTSTESSEKPKMARTMSTMHIPTENTQSNRNMKPIIVEAGGRELAEKLGDLAIRVEEIEHQMSKNRRSDKGESITISNPQFNLDDDALAAINKRIDHCCSRETVDKVLQIVKTAVSKMGTRVDALEKNIEGVIHKDEFVKYLNAIHAASEDDNMTAGATRGYKCLLCGREKGGVVGMITDSEIARLMGEPQSCAPVRAGDTVILNYSSGTVRPKTAVATRKTKSTKLPKIEDKS